jgi:hypothetical protein
MVGSAVDSLVNPFTAEQIASGAPEDTYGMSYVFLWFICLPAAVVGTCIAVYLGFASGSRSQKLILAAAVTLFIVSIAIVLVSHGRLKHKVLGEDETASPSTRLAVLGR